MIAYIKARLNERSTFMLVVSAIVTASALPSPWSYLAVAVGIIAAFVPDGTLK